MKEWTHKVWDFLFYFYAKWRDKVGQVWKSCGEKEKSSKGLVKQKKTKNNKGKIFILLNQKEDAGKVTRSRRNMMKKKVEER